MHHLNVCRFIIYELCLNIYYTCPPVRPSPADMGIGPYGPIHISRPGGQQLNGLTYIIAILSHSFKFNARIYFLHKK